MTRTSTRLAAAVATVLVLGCALLAAAPASATAAGAGLSTGPDAQALADRYAPVVMVRRHDAVCDSDGEPYVPMTVDAVLGNPEVALRQVGNGDPVIRWAPTAADLFGRGEGVYLDLPGDALKPGCVYASDSARYNPGGRSAVYAHVVQQADRPDLLAVQFWLFWYYNDWNDKHESDWEFVQVLFRASSVAEALSGSPVSVGYAQHTGGEVSDWGDEKLERDGTHPVVYSSQNSHASYVEPALFLGRGASEGFGCDNTQAPSTRLTPRVVLLPDQPSGRDDPFAWLDFQGRWGERQASPNNGPTGPLAKPRWAAPVDWQDELRATSFVVPGGEAAAPPIITAFCTVVGKGSEVFIAFVASPARVLGVLALLAGGLAFLLRRTSWRSVPPLPVVARRRAGEIARASITLYRARPLTFAGLGLIAVPVAAVVVVVAAVLNRLPYLGDAASVAESGDVGGRALVSTLVGLAFWPVTLTLVTAAVSWVLSAAPGESRSVRAALGAVRAHGRALGSAFVLAVAVVVLLSVTVFALPVAAWVSVRVQFLAPVAMVEGRGGRTALRRSGVLTRGRWFHTAVVAFLVWATVNGVGLLIGLVLLVLVTSLPLWVVSASVVVAQVALAPLGGAVLSLLYGDARAEREERGKEPVVPAQEAVEPVG